MPSVPPVAATPPRRFDRDDWVRLRRFLTLGSETGTYFAKDRSPTNEGSEGTARCLAADGERVVREIVSVVQAGHAPRVDFPIFALSLAASATSETTRRAALDALPLVCRTGAQLFRFAHFVGGRRGWGRGLRAAVAHWYNEKSVKEVASQVVRYAHGDGFRHRDMLRLAHPEADTYGRRTLYHWIASGWERIGDAPHDQTDLQIVWAAEKARVPGTTAKTVAELIRVYDLPREAVPSGLLHEKAVWEALLERMPLNDLLHYLPTLTRVGVLDGRVWQTEVVARLTDAGKLAAARVHPITVFAAQKRYVLGRDERGKHRWSPNPKIGDALGAAFDAALSMVRPTGKRVVVGINATLVKEASGVAGMPGITPYVLAAATTLVTGATEPGAEIMAFSSERIFPVGVSSHSRLADVAQTLTQQLDSAGRSGGEGITDRAAPIEWATRHGTAADVFLLFTDTEPGFGAVAAHALREYREKTGIPARLVLINAGADDATVADSDDAGILTVIGFDTTTPDVITNFLQAH